MPLSNDERTAFEAIIAVCLDELDLVGRGNNSLKNLPRLNDNRIQQYLDQFDAHWETILADLGIVRATDDTAFDAAPGWNAAMDRMLSRLATEVGDSRFLALRHVDIPCRTLARHIMWVAATGRAWLDGG
jgi:hypothetical protein